MTIASRKSGMCTATNLALFSRRADSFRSVFIKATPIQVAATRPRRSKPLWSNINSDPSRRYGWRPGQYYRGEHEAHSLALK